MEDLKPCPFCGGDAVWLAVCPPTIRCTKCSTEMMVGVASVSSVTRDAWNTRTDTGEVKNLQDTLNTAGFLLADEKAEVASLREAVGEAIEILVLIGGDGAWDRDIDKLRRSLSSKGPAE